MSFSMTRSRSSHQIGATSAEDPSSSSQPKSLQKARSFVLSNLRRTSSIFNAEGTLAPHSHEASDESEDQKCTSQIEMLSGRIADKQRQIALWMESLIQDAISTSSSTSSSSPESEEKLEQLKDLLSDTFEDVSNRSKLESQLRDIKSNRLVRSYKYSEACEVKLAGMRDRTTQLEAQVADFKKQVKDLEDKDIATTTVMNVLEAKYESLKAEYFQNLLSKYGRRFAAKGAESAALTVLKDTFEDYLNLREGKIRTEVEVLHRTFRPDAEGADGMIGGVRWPTGKVTLVFTDVQGSTEMWDKAEIAMEAGLEMHNTIMRRLLNQYTGYEVKTEGDAFMVAFASPVNAIQWCAAVQHELLTTEWPAGLLAFPGAERVLGEDGNFLFNGIRVRMGIHVGAPKCEVDPCTKRMDYFGPMVNLSARVSGRAQGGQIVVSSDFYDAVKHVLKDIGEGIEATSLGPQNFKGISRPVEVFQLAPMSLRARKFNVAAKADADFDANEKFFVDAEPLKMNQTFIQAAAERLRKRQIFENKLKHANAAYDSIMATKLAIRALTGHVQKYVAQCREQCEEIIYSAAKSMYDLLGLYMDARDETREILHRRVSMMTTTNPDGTVVPGYEMMKNLIPKTPHIPIDLAKLDWFAPLIQQRTPSMRRRHRSPPKIQTGEASGDAKGTTEGSPKDKEIEVANEEEASPIGDKQVTFSDEAINLLTESPSRNGGNGDILPRSRSFPTPTGLEQRSPKDKVESQTLTLVGSSENVNIHSEPLPELPSTASTVQTSPPPLPAKGSSKPFPRKWGVPTIATVRDGREVREVREGSSRRSSYSDPTISSARSSSAPRRQSTNNAGPIPSSQQPPQQGEGRTTPRSSSQVLTGRGKLPSLFEPFAPAGFYIAPLRPS